MSPPANKTKYWRERPPGPEQTELERMFLDNEINYFTPIEEVQQRNRMFMEFSDRIFSAHFRKTRALLGLCASAPSVPPVPAKKIRTIPELSGTPIVSGVPTNASAVSPIPCTSQSANANQNVDDDATVISPLECFNSPYKLWVYTDHQKKTDFVCVLLPVFYGDRDIKFELSEDGMMVTVLYTWPSPFYRADEFFEEKINNGDISNEHPKVHCFVSNGIDMGITENSNPRGKMTIALPIQVKREIGSWKKEAVVVKGIHMIMLEFTAYQKALLVNDMDTSINFA